MADKLFWTNTSLIDSSSDNTVSAVMPFTGNVMMALNHTVVNGTCLLKISKDAGVTTLAVAGATDTALGTVISTEPVPQGCLLELDVTDSGSMNLAIGGVEVQQLDIVDSGDDGDLIFWTNPAAITTNVLTALGSSYLTEKASKFHIWNLGLTATTFGTWKMQYSTDGGTTKIDVAGATGTAADYKISTGYVPQGALLYFDLTGSTASTFAIGTIIIQQDSATVIAGE